MRKATWGAISLGAWAVSFGSPIREIPLLHQVLGILLIVGYLLVSMDPPAGPTKRQRDLMIAGVVCGILSVVIVLGGSPPPVVVLARMLAVAVAALPLWLVAGPMRAGFIAAGVLAAVTIVPALEDAGGAATSLHAYVAALSCFGVALLLERPALLSGEKKPPRVVVGRDVVFLTPEEKAQRLARLEKRFQAGEIPEHKYWDLRQEIESR